MAGYTLPTVDKSSKALYRITAFMQTLAFLKSLPYNSFKHDTTAKHAAGESKREMRFQQERHATD
jgi:hypothetical protein